MYFKFLSMHIKSELAYPGSFAFSCIGRLLLMVNGLIGIRVMMWRFGTVGDYNSGEVLLGFGVVAFAFHIAECFARGFDAFGRIVRQGTFDRLMIRPRGLIFQVICQDMRLASFFTMLFDIVLIYNGAASSGIAWSIPKYLVLISMVVCGSLIFWGAFLVYAALCFYTYEGLEVFNIFTDGVRNYSKYPYDVYGKGVLFFTTAIMPMAMVQYWPLQYLRGIGKTIYALFPLISLWFLVPCILIWNHGVKHYTSAGS